MDTESPLDVLQAKTVKGTLWSSTVALLAETVGHEARP